MKHVFHSHSLALLLALSTAGAAELHVAITGKDANPGTSAAPLRTIQHAADLAQPGDTITVHAGVYRERVSPPHGGESDARRIVYQAEPGAKVEITGSEPVTHWVKVQDDVWQATLPNAFFGGFNPFNDIIHGDWFQSPKRKLHTGAVYLNGEWLVEAATRDEVLKPTAADALWFAEVDAANTTIWAQFKGVNPNEQLVEVNVRQSVFYPEKTGINFLTVRGFTLRHAATPWAPPTAEQIGLIGTHWSKGWIIENNVISHSACAGVTLGKYGDEWDNRAGSAEGYVGTIKRALANGWNSATIGHHLVRNNDISHCEQGGIIGSLGGAFSTITGNTIHEIYVRKLFTGQEMAGIKLHGGIDVRIVRNHIYQSHYGVWLDWMGQGARISQNLMHDNSPQDIYLEVNHGPILVDNNLLLSKSSISSYSRGVAYVHNLIGGPLHVKAYDNRVTPFHKPHSTELAGMHDNPRGDDRYYNNLLAGGTDLSQYNDTQLPMAMAGNVFLEGAKPARFETNPLVQADFAPAPALAQESDGWYLQMKFDPAWTAQRTRKLATTGMLGLATVPNAAFEQPDGAPIRISTDYFGKTRNEANPCPGPFENPGQGELKIKVW